jgi:hypothetical protein
MDGERNHIDDRYWRAVVVISNMALFLVMITIKILQDPLRELFNTTVVYGPSLQPSFATRILRYVRSSGATFRPFF